MSGKVKDRRRKGPKRKRKKYERGRNNVIKLQSISTSVSEVILIYI